MRAQSQAAFFSKVLQSTTWPSAQGLSLMARTTTRGTRGLRDGAALHLAAQVAEGREDALLLFRGRDGSVGKVLSKGVVRRRKTSMTDYRLEQVADYLCTIELALVKCEAKENGETYNKFFGGIGSFKRN